METTPEELELVGALFGDGNIYTNKRKYLVAFTGNPKNEAEYFEKLAFLIEKEWSKKATPKIRSKGIRIALYSKELVLRLTAVFGLVPGKGKCDGLVIPQHIL